VFYSSSRWGEWDFGKEENFQTRSEKGKEQAASAGKGAPGERKKKSGEKKGFVLSG